MKRVVIIASVVIVLLAAIYFTFFDTIGLTTLSEQESIESFFTLSPNIIAAVADNGNVYVKGDLSSDLNFGSDKIRQYSHLINKRFIQIYNKGDAVRVELSSYGGCIITERSDVYVFVNGSKEYKTPTLLCTGYKKANLVEDNVYLLSDNGSFGLVNLEHPDNFKKLGDNVIDFQIEYSNSLYPYNVCFALTADNRLYISEIGEFLSDNVQHIDEIIGFDSAVITSDLPSDSTMTNHIVLGLLDKKHDVLWHNDDLNKNSGISKLTDISNYSVAGNSMDKICVYPYGIAMMDKTGDVALYGSDFQQTKNTFSGETVFHNVKDIFGGELLMIIYNDGSIEYYGYSDYFPEIKRFID